MWQLVSLMLRGGALIFFGYTLIVIYGVVVLTQEYTSVDGIFVIAGVSSFLLGVALWKAADWIAVRYGQSRPP
jgi:hypothetical protein